MKTFHKSAGEVLKPQVPVHHIVGTGIISCWLSSGQHVFDMEIVWVKLPRRVRFMHLVANYSYE